MSLYQDKQVVNRKTEHTFEKIIRVEFWLDIMDLHVIMNLARQSAGAASTRSGELTKKWPSAYQGRTAIFYG